MRDRYGVAAYGTKNVLFGLVPVVSEQLTIPFTTNNSHNGLPCATGQSLWIPEKAASSHNSNAAAPPSTGHPVAPHNDKF